MKTRFPTVSNARHGFSMLEVAFALGIIAFCLVGLIGMLPIGIRNNQISVAETGATSLATSLVGDLKNTPVTTSTSSFYGIPIDTSSHTLFFNATAYPAGTVDEDADSSKLPFYRATLSFSNASTSTQKAPTIVRILITWPALADRTANVLPSKYTSSYETVIVLDRQ